MVKNNRGCSWFIKPWIQTSRYVRHGNYFSMFCVTKFLINNVYGRKSHSFEVVFSSVNSCFRHHVTSTRTSGLCVLFFCEGNIFLFCFFGQRTNQETTGINHRSDPAGADCLTCPAGAPFRCTVARFLPYAGARNTREDIRLPLTVFTR